MVVSSHCDMIIMHSFIPSISKSLIWSKQLFSTFCHQHNKKCRKHCGLRKSCVSCNKIIILQELYHHKQKHLQKMWRNISWTKQHGCTARASCTLWRWISTLPVKVKSSVETSFCAHISKVSATQLLCAALLCTTESRVFKNPSSISSAV